jgi:hypothetical protein
LLAPVGGLEIFLWLVTLVLRTCARQAKFCFPPTSKIVG